MSDPTSAADTEQKGPTQYAMVTANAHASLASVFAQALGTNARRWTFVQGAPFNRRLPDSRECSALGDIAGVFLPEDERGEMLNPKAFFVGMADVVFSLTNRPDVDKFMPVAAQPVSLNTTAAKRLTPRSGDPDLCGTLAKCLEALGSPQEIIKAINALRKECMRLSKLGPEGIREWPAVVERVVGVPLSSIDPSAATVLKIFTADVELHARIDALDPAFHSPLRWVSNLLSCHLQGSLADAVTAIYVISGHDLPPDDCSYAERVAHLAAAAGVIREFLDRAPASMVGGAHHDYVGMGVRVVQELITDAEYDDNLCSALVAAVAAKAGLSCRRFAILPTSKPDKPQSARYRAALEKCGHTVIETVDSRNWEAVWRYGFRFEDPLD